MPSPKSSIDGDDKESVTAIVGVVLLGVMVPHASSCLSRAVPLSRRTWLYFARSSGDRESMLTMERIPRRNDFTKRGCLSNARVTRSSYRA